MRTKYLVAALIGLSACNTPDVSLPASAIVNNSSQSDTASSSPIAAPAAATVPAPVSSSSNTVVAATTPAVTQQVVTQPQPSSTPSASPVPTQQQQRYMYGISFNNWDISEMRLDPVTGAAEDLVIPSSVSMGTAASSIKMDPTGDYLYALTGSTTQVFAIDQASGNLSYIKTIATASGNGKAYSMAFLNGFAFLQYVANGKFETQIAQFSMDAGDLTFYVWQPYNFSATLDFTVTLTGSANGFDYTANRTTGNLEIRKSGEIVSLQDWSDFTSFQIK